ncbi:hypothetical protein FRB95_012998 [Tulasnella sp. JGI-2019a]|nr:hypothetical protein FRB95_012998 [Tulasnella sp. JGI-2019a]
MMSIEVTAQCHPALLIDEVLLPIFATLLAGHRKGTLASAAVTCRAWSDPALDQLWSGLDKEINLKEADGMALYFMRSLNWIRFETISRRVRQVQLGSDVEEQIFLDLYRSNPGSLPLLPNIRRLDFSGRHCDHSLLFIGPNLSGLRLCLTDKSAGFLAQIPTRSPQISSLAIDVYDWMAWRSMQDISHLFSSLSALQDLRLDITNLRDISVLVHDLGELPTLQHLTFLNYHHSQTQTLRWIPIVSTSFPRLNHFTYSGRVCSWVPGLLRHLAPLVKLQNLRLRGSLQRGRFWSNVAELLAAAGDHENLESLQVYCCARHLSLEKLIPILQCSALTSLKVSVGRSIDMDDEDMKILASSLPRLQNLSLFSLPCHSNP